jgi:poly(ADP-ribose) glycohydrolase
MQKIIWPWSRKNWNEIKNKVSSPISSLVEFDSRLASMQPGIMKPRKLTELFTQYETAESPIPKDTIINEIIPLMQKLIVDAPKLFHNFDGRLLVRADNIAFTRPQVATLIACLWFGLFNYNYVASNVPQKITMADMPDPSFIDAISNQNLFVLQCVMNYFHRVLQYMKGDEQERDLFVASYIIVKRAVLTEPPNWVDSNLPICDLLLGDTPSVDKTNAKMKIAFAHQHIGSTEIFKGVMSQEEILLMIYPECMVATLFCPKLSHNETILVLGAEKFSEYAGYGSSVQYKGNFNDNIPYGYSANQTEAMMQNVIVFMDASTNTAGKNQFITDFQRDLNKAYCGMSSIMFSTPGVHVAGGNWTYGFSGHNMQIKFIQQLLAASQSGKSLVYHSVSHEFEDAVSTFSSWLLTNNYTIGDLFKAYLRLIRACSAGAQLSNLDIFTCIMEDQY